LAIVANEGRVAVDAEAPLTNGAVAYDKGVWSCRLGAGVKLLSFSGMMVARKPITRESAL
jgi:hypothetical protein